MRQKLIWLGLQVVENMERETGLEPATSSLGSWHSTTELLPRSCVFRYLTVPQGLIHKWTSRAPSILIHFTTSSRYHNAQSTSPVPLAPTYR